MATIAQNLAALQQARTDIAGAITDKGVTLEEGAGFTDFPQAIENIPTGVDTSNDTVTSATLAKGVTAHNAAGEQITGTLDLDLYLGTGFSTIHNYSIPNKAIWETVTTTNGTYGCKTINTGAFGNLTNVKSIFLSSTVETINNLAFYSCPNLISIDVDTDNTRFSSEDGVLFNKNKTIIVRYPCGGGISYTIPSSVTSINDRAFYSCPNITSVAIPSSVTSINSNSFGQAPNLTTITINKPQGSVSGAPWGATNATVVWTG